MPSIVVNLFGEKMMVWPETSTVTENMKRESENLNQLTFDDLRHPRLPL